MPAEIVTGRFCADAFSAFEVPGTGPGTVWRVSLGGMLAHCSCPAFAHFKGPEYDRTCKHIAYVWAHGCLWNEQWYDGGTDELAPVPDSCQSPMIPDATCPRCSGPVVPVKIAV